MPIDQSTYWAAAAAGIPLLALIWKMSSTQSHPPFPPGPPRYPIIGSLRSFPQTKWQETFTKLRETYGGLIYYEVLGQPFLIVNSLEVAKELMDKRGNIYSGRPVDVMHYTV
jgi:Cytochrome P450